jgi:hypothetical protein
MPIEKTVSLIESLHLDSESINTWKTGVCRALKQYIVDGTKSKGKCLSERLSDLHVVRLFQVRLMFVST